MTTGKSHAPASLAGAAGMLLVQEGRGDEALFLARSDSSGRLVGDEQRRMKQQPAWSRVGRSMAERWEGQSKMGDGFLGNVRSSGKGGQPTWVAMTRGHDPRPLVPSAWPPGTGLAHGTERPSQAVKQKRAADMWAQPC
jgi:hypothetical protein